MNFKLSAISGLVLLGALAAASPARAQQTPQSVFGERIEVRVVNLEAVVEDRDGNRVSGLGPEDFRLRVDGKEVPIDYFTEVSGGRRVAPPAAAGEVRALPGIAADPGEEVGTSYLVFVDDFFASLGARRNQALEALAEDLARLGPRDRMAIVSFDGKKVEMLSSWSQSPAELERALRQAMGRPARGVRTGAAVGFADELARLDTDVAATEDTVGLGAGENVGDASPLERTDPQFGAASREATACSTIRYIEAQLRRVVVGVTSTLRGFAQPPGRKVLLLYSGGWPHSAYDYVLGATDPLARSGECESEGPRLYKPIYDVANLLGYTVYPVDVPGRDGPGVDAAASDDVLAQTGPGIDGSSATRVDVPLDLSRRTELHATLHRLARETGGRALLDGARLAAFERVVEDTRSYYWLGFTPDWRGDDRGHEIKLEVRRPGLKVRTREGFQDLSRGKEIDFMVEGALMFGELPGARPLAVKLGTPGKGKRRVELPMEIVIPMDEVTMLPHQGQYVAELELRIGAIDEKGNRNEIASVPVTLAGPTPPPPGSHSVYETAVKIRRQPQELVVTLHDPLSDRILAAVTKVEL